MAWLGSLIYIYRSEGSWRKGINFEFLNNGYHLIIVEICKGAIHTSMLLPKFNIKPIVWLIETNEGN